MRLPNEHAWHVLQHAMRLHNVLDPSQPRLAGTGLARNTELSWHSSARVYMYHRNQASTSWPACKCSCKRGISIQDVLLLITIYYSEGILILT